MNIRKGLFRAWLVFTILWATYFSWATYDSYTSYKSWQDLSVKWSQSIDEMLTRYEGAPYVSEGGLDKQYYKLKIKQYDKEFQESITYRDEEFDRFEKSRIYGPLAPISMILIYHIAIYIISGFRASDKQHPNPKNNPEETTAMNKAAFTEKNSCEHDSAVKAKKEAIDVTHTTRNINEESEYLKAAEFWPRLGARCVDIPIIFIFAELLSLPLTDINILPTGYSGVLVSVLLWNTWICALLILYEILFIHNFGATPGKAMFGLRVSSVNHRNPTMKESMQRAKSFVTQGLGLMLFFPYVQIFTAWNVHRTWQSKNSTPWDLASRTFVEQKSVSQGRLSIVIPIAAILITSLFIGQMAMKQARKNEALREQVSQ